ncbi:MAG: hypothetical protein HYR55_10370 [Acidobacteria bacterium]|nr:hypothetical protein [Acidobacteriota bacterium]MBI3658792.1 hypothetical protein [Acidobacteriota bacterium]
MESPNHRSTCVAILALLLVFLFGTCAALPCLAAAEEPHAPPDSVRAEIEQLRSQIRLLEARMEALSQQRTSPAAEKPVPAETPLMVESVPGRGQTDTSLYYGLSAGSPEKRYGRGVFGDMVKIGGYGSFRYEANNIDKAPQVGDLPRAQRSANGFDFRRFVLTTDISPNDRLRIYSEIEYERFSKLELARTAIPENLGSPGRPRAGTRFIQETEGRGELGIEQAWAQYNVARDVGIRVGVVLPPVGRLNTLHDDDYWDLPRRTLVDRGASVLPIPAAWRELGAGLVGKHALGAGFINYQFYVVNGVTLDFSHEVTAGLRSGRGLLAVEPEIHFDNGPFNGSQSTRAVTWRLGLSPKLGSEIALSGYHGRYTPSYLNLNTGLNSVALDGKFTYRRFEAEGEFIYSDYGRMRGVVGAIARQLVTSTVETLGSETRELETEVELEASGPLTNQRYGFWLDLKYRFWPEFLNRTFLGRGFENPQLIPIFRYDRVWFNGLVTDFRFKDRAITRLDSENLSQDRITTGLSYRPISSVVVTAAYEHNHRRQGSTLIFPRSIGLGRLPDRSYDSLVLGMSFGF